MAEKWDKQLKEVLKFTREELKRTGDELKTHAQRLLEEVQDPTKQAKVKEGLQTLRTWAVATGKQAAEQIESAVRRVEETVEGAFDKREASSTPQPPPAAPPPPPAAKKAARPGASKSIGRKKPAAKAPPSATKKAAAKPGASKSIGRKKPARQGS